MKTRWCILVLTGVLLSACTPGKGFETADVSRSDFGDQWPFAADEGVLSCDPGGVPSFTVDGISVGLNKPNLNAAVWADSATEATAAAMRDEALELCD